MTPRNNNLFFPRCSFSPHGGYISKIWKHWNNIVAVSHNVVDDMQIHDEIEYVLTVTMCIFENIFTNPYNWKIFLILIILGYLIWLLRTKY